MQNEAPKKTTFDEGVIFQQKFGDPSADHALFTGIKENLLDDIEMIELDFRINDAPSPKPAQKLC